MGDDIYDGVWELLMDKEKQDFLHPLNYQCSVHGSTGIFLFEESDLEVHGFTPLEAPHGICISCAYNPIGDETGHNAAFVKEEDYLNQNYFVSDGGKTKATILEFRDLSDEELKKEMETTIGLKAFGENFVSKYRIKSLYRSAIGEDTYRKMDPPYWIGNRRLLYSAKVTDESIKLGEEERSTFIPKKNDWFLCLQDSLKQREMSLLDPACEQLPPRPAYCLMCTYLHKSVEFNHIEPLWVFMKRMNLGDTQIKNALKSWITPVPKTHLSHVKSLCYYSPGKGTLRAFINSIFQCGEEIKFSKDEKDKLQNKSEKVFNKLIRKQIKNPNSDTFTNLSDYINSIAIFDNTFSIGAQQIHAIGFVEALCVNYAAKRVLDSSKARVLERKYLFPKNNGNPWWIDALPIAAKEIYSNRFDRLMKSLEN